MVDVQTFETPSLGDRSYLISEGEVGVVIDPQRDIDRFLDAAEERGVEITHVLETHIHNDYVSGGLALAERTGATYMVAADEDVAFDHEPLRDGDEIVTGDIRLRVVHTPGHTPTHLSYVLVVQTRPIAVFTGGSLLYAAVGRTDLVADADPEELSRLQFRSARELAETLPHETVIHPTHGFGSHCATTTDEIVRDGTIADELERNPALTAEDEDRFVKDLLAGLHPYPSYYAHMGPRNAEGAEAPDLSMPRPLDADALRQMIEAGHWVVDLRQRRAYAADHVRGTVNVELRDDLPTYLGWVIPWDVPFALLADDADAISDAQVMLARIGLDEPAGAGVGGPDAWRDGVGSSWDVANWQDLADALDGRDDVVVLDVREAWEFESGHHPDAAHIPFYELPDRLDDVPGGQVWIYCATGNRATVAGSLLERAGRDVVLIDDFCLPGDTPGA